MGLDRERNRTSAVREHRDYGKMLGKSWMLSSTSARGGARPSE